MEAERVLIWFSGGRRSLPWRTPFPRDPYHVVVSEFMLQQTQASRVAELFPKFLQRFPTLEALACATEEEVLAAFAGLGYYRRARLLHRLAGVVRERGWPRSASELAKLPGMGRYTAAAVAAFAFGELTPPVDGNLRRITARFLGLHLAADDHALHTAAASFARGLTRQHPTPEVYEALMELGATVCTPQKPRCGDCPWAERCTAFKTGKPQAFPQPKRGRPREDQTWVALWAENPAGEVLWRQVTEPPLAGLWLPPLDRGSGDPAGRAVLLAQSVGLPTNVSKVGVVRHSITHRRITVVLFRLQVPWRVAEAQDGCRWDHPSAFVPVSSLANKLVTLAVAVQQEVTNP